MATWMQLATAREVASMLKLTESTICSLASRGKLPGIKVGKSWRFDLEKIERIFSRDPNGGESPRGSL
jgi:excisionase family DNA binding protein